MLILLTRQFDCSDLIYLNGLGTQEKFSTFFFSSYNNFKHGKGFEVDKKSLSTLRFNLTLLVAISDEIKSLVQICVFVSCLCFRRNMKQMHAGLEEKIEVIVYGF